MLKGVESADVSGARSTMHVAFNPDLVTIGRIEEEARRIGADLAVDVQHATVELTDLDCPDCAVSIERDVSRLPGVLWAGANFASAQMHVEFRPDRTSLRQICRVASDHGIKACALPRPGTEPAEARPADSWWSEKRRLIITLSALLLTALGIAASYETSLATVPLCALAIIVGGASTLRGALASLRGRAMDMNVLMTVAVVGAAAIGEWTEGASVVALYSLGNLLQAGAMERTRRSIRGLLSLAPQTGRVVRGTEQIVRPVRQIEPEELLLVKAGERIPLDGLVTNGTSSVNEAPITGESMPRMKSPGDTVFGGTLNGNGPLEVKVTRRYRDTTLARIIHRVEEAQAQRAPTQQLIDRFARVYTPIVVALSLSVCLLPSVAITVWDRFQSIPVPADLWPAWFLKGLALLIIACPCALVISTPVAIVTAIGNASRHGALIKGGAYLEAIGRLRSLLWDKTGTLTEGKLRLIDTVVLDGRSGNEALAIAAALENRSEHPLAAAFPHGNNPHLAVEEFESVPGMGARGRVAGRDYLIGSLRFLEQAGVDVSALNQPLDNLASQSGTIVALAEDRKIAALFAIGDTARPEARAVVSDLAKLGLKEQAVVTGDNDRAAQSAAVAAGIAQVRADLLPEEKMSAVREFQQRVGPVGMIGDGINDAPALASADVGFAMAAEGSDTAIETSDVALMGDDLTRLPYLIRLSRTTSRIIRQNIAFSLATKLGLVVAAITVGLPLWLAVAGDVGVSLIVTLNALRLRS